MAALSLELVQFVENEFATMNDLIAQRLHVRMEPCRRSHTVFVADLGADRHFGFESALHRVDQREDFLLRKNRGANFPKPEKESFTKLWVGQPRASEKSGRSPPTNESITRARAAEGLWPLGALHPALNSSMY